MPAGDAPVHSSNGAARASRAPAHRSTATDVFISTLRSLRPDPVLRARLDRLERELARRAGRPRHA